MLEFPADDAAGGDHEDALFEMSFHIPKENDRFGTGDESTSAAEVSTMWLGEVVHKVGMLDEIGMFD